MVWMDVMRYFFFFLNLSADFSVAKKVYCICLDLDTSFLSDWASSHMAMTFLLFSVLDYYKVFVFEL
jgi:hypothetical protein